MASTPRRAVTPKSISKGERLPRAHRFNPLSALGPGLITGAADDDPSGIATYSQAGAQFGFQMLWTMPFSLPTK